MIGRIFGRLVVLRDSGKRNRKGEIIWLCRCDCGNIKEVPTNYLTRGSTRSCGCLKKGGPSHHRFIHGDSGTRLYRIWACMKYRCYLKTDPKYKYYGARGIVVYSSWLDNFRTFKIWALSHGYQNNLTIDRINSKGNYEPSNCQWLTNEENSSKAWRDRKL